MGKKTGYFGCLLLCILLFITGCGNGGEKTKVVLTTGFGKDEVFQIEGEACVLPEIMVYLTNIQNQYEDIYGSQIWEISLPGTTLEQNIKDTVLARLAQIKVMNLLAQKYEVTLDEKEEGLAQQAGKLYYDSLNESERTGMGVDEARIVSMYEEYALADKVYRYIIKDINPEISDDEARTITVEHILIRTSEVDENGERVAYDAQKKEEAYALAKEVLAKAQAGEIIVIENLKLDAIKTRDFAAFLKAIDVSGKALVVTPEVSENIVKSARNIPGVTTTTATILNVYDILNAGKFIVDRDAVAKIQEVFA